MIRNAEQLAVRFPQARVHIYIAPDVPDTIRTTLAAMPNVNIYPVDQKSGSAGMFDRFMAIDEPDCSVMFVRDADSRVHERDAACIEDFLASDKTLHIIRDHKYHWQPIMGGMWGIRKSGMTATMKEMLLSWTITDAYCNDQHFLQYNVYPLYKSNAIIHDRLATFKDETLTPFRVPIVNHLFVGQIHLIGEDGAEKIVCNKD
jgi:hypothetical protein